MPSVRIWTLESDNDAKVVRCLANKLAKHLHLRNISVRTASKKDIPKDRDKGLVIATQNFLKQEDYVIFVIDNDGPMSRHQRNQESSGDGPKEYLEEFSERVLLELNPDMPQKNVDRERYHERISPDVADHVLIDRETLRRNNSLRKLGNVLAQFK